MSEKEALEKLDYIISESVQNRLVADVPVGLFLSGGIDSSLIAYYSKKYSSNIRSFTIKMGNDSYDESKYADIVSRHLDIKNHSILLSENDLVNSLVEIEDKLDETQKAKLNEIKKKKEEEPELFSMDEIIAELDDNDLLIADKRYGYRGPLCTVDISQGVIAVQNAMIKENKFSEEELINKDLYILILYLL